VYPVENTDTALVSTQITVNFRSEMLGSTINENTFTVSSDGAPVDGVVVVPGITTTTSAVFIPDSDLVSGMVYEATISSDVVDSAGNHPLSRDYVWSFTVSGTISLVSRDMDDVVGNNTSDTSDIDGDGQYIVFESTATNLVTDVTTGGINQIYRKNTLTGEVLLVSSDASGLVAANNASSSPRISDDGRYVVFESTATNLAAIASGGFSQIYLKDLADGSVDMISRNSTLTAGAGNSFNPDISSDGRYIVFDSDATNLGGTGYRHVYLVDTDDPDTIELISVDSSEVPGNGPSSNPSISDDGQRIAFASTATNLDTDNNIFSDIFLRERDPNGTTVLISMNSTSSGSANAASSNPEISGDGQSIVFESPATDIDGGIPGRIDIFLSDTVNPATRITVKNGVGADDDSANPSISFDGRYIAFESEATNLDTGTFNKSNIFVSDITTPDDIKRLSLISDVNSNNARISSDGRYVSFDSPYSFTLDDTNNGLVDIYRAYNSTF
jgi:Tol biopolymer transport system component